MRWLIVSMLLTALVIFSFTGRYLHQPADAPKDKVVGEVVRQKPTRPKAEPKQETSVDQKLEAAKPFLQDKTRLKAELANDPHGTPPALMKAGQALGEIAELEARHPEHRAEFIRYYRDCYESEETMTVTRVQCLKHYIRSARLSEVETRTVIAALPRPVQRLYQNSTTLR